MSTLTVNSPLSGSENSIPYSTAFYGTGAATIANLLQQEDLVLLFLKASEEELAKKANFKEQLRRFLAQPINRRVKFLWIENPLDALFEWRTNTLAVEKIGGDYQISALTYFDIRNYAFGISKGCKIRLDKTHFLIERNNNEEAFELANGYGEHRIFSIGNQVTLPIEGAETGCLKFPFNIQVESWEKDGQLFFGYQGLTQLDVGLRIFFRDPDIPETGDDFYLESHRYPIFDEVHPLLNQTPEDVSISATIIAENHSLKDKITTLLKPIGPELATQIQTAFNYYPESIPFSVIMDPLYPLEPKRTSFTFGEIVGTSATLGFPSTYKTNLGYTVFLAPIDTQSKLHFALRPIELTNNELSANELQTAPYYLVPAGDFSVRVPFYHHDGSEDIKPVANIDCGISGVEYIKITHPEDESVSPAILTFIPGQPAYAPSHVSVAALVREFPFILEGNIVEVLEEKLKDLTDELKDIAKNIEGSEEKRKDLTDEIKILKGNLIDAFKLTPNTTDQDQNIPNKRAELTIRSAIMDYLEIIIRDYFPVDFSFTERHSAEYNALERVEELVTWLQNTLITTQQGQGVGDLIGTATTSWVYMKQSGNTAAVYYAQPEQAILYKAEPSSIDFLDFLEIPSVGLPLSVGITGIPLAFPMLPYGDVDPYTLTDLRLLEISLINNFRRKRIQEISADTGHATALGESSSEKPIGTTPQGLMATFSKDYRTIERLDLAKYTTELDLAETTPKEPVSKAVSLVGITHGSPLKAAIQSNQLFMVISAPATLSTNFKESIVDQIDNFGNGLDATTALEIKKWIFQLGTESWDKNNRNTLLIFKFHDKPLIELAARPELWSFPSHFNKGQEENVSVTLLGLLNEAIEIGNRKDPKESGKYEVLAQAATQANWTGVLALNTHVPPNGLPPELIALAAGIEPDLFYAQYVGIELTPVTSDGSQLSSRNSSLFGLIDYENLNIPEATEDGYNFHVASLTVVFENSRIKDFSAEILLIIEKLFGERCRLIGSPNNIISLIGVAEEHNGKMTYSFGFKGANRFKLSGHALEEVEIIKTQFVTDPIPDLNADPLPVVGRFIFWGRIRVAYLEKFDILSFGRSPSEKEGTPDYLSFSKLQIEMKFDIVADAETKPVAQFEFLPESMAFDLKKSGWRKQSLYEKFPLIFRGFIVGKTDNALQSGFMKVNTPLKSVALGGKDENGQDIPWYGMTFSINMESAEDLGTKATIKADILVGWNAGKPGLFVGLKFPGSSGTDRSLTIAGLLKLVFKSIRFVVYPLTKEWDENGNKLISENAEREVGYLLNLKNIRLEFFKISFPPIGKTEITLFGDPTPGKDRDKRLVGWYGSYVKK